jgi:Cellulase (glycosyl hydrolase family 5)
MTFSGHLESFEEKQNAPQSRSEQLNLVSISGGGDDVDRRGNSHSQSWGINTADSHLPAVEIVGHGASTNGEQTAMTNSNAPTETAEAGRFGGGNEGLRGAPDWINQHSAKHSGTAAAADSGDESQMWSGGRGFPGSGQQGGETAVVTASDKTGTGMPADGAQTLTSAAQAASGSDAPNANGGPNTAGFDQPIQAQLQQMQEELQQISTELTQLTSEINNVPNGGGETPVAASAPVSVPIVGDNTAPAMPTTMSDPFIAGLRQSDPTMAQTLTDATSHLSAQGYSQLESYVQQNYSGSANDNQLMSQALTQAGLSSSDDSALTNVLQQDMPFALNLSPNAPVATDSVPSTPTATPTPTPSDTASTTPSTSSPSDTASSTTATSTQGDSAGGTGTTNTGGTGSDSGTGTTNTIGTGGDGGTGVTNAGGTGSDTGNYSVVNGTIIGPNGQPFDGKGLAVYAPQLSQSQAAAIMQEMPGLNFIRLTSVPASDSPADIQADIQDFQSINPNVVVEVEDHTFMGSTDTPLEGAALTTEENWYSQIAAANVNNPNVWFGTANEPNDSSDEQQVVNQEVGIYNAIRGAGSNNMVMLEADGGGTFGPQQADPSAYAAMNNVAWDMHFYGGVTNGDTSVSDNISAIQSEAGGANGITESNGSGGQQNIPVIVGEYGDSINGQNLDSNGTAAVDAVQTANNQGLVQGAVAWIWDGNYNPNDAITLDGTPSTITPYGQELINYVNNGSTGSVT